MPVVYNDIGGDADVTLDRAIKAAYGPRYAIVDTGRSAGYSGPSPTAGSLPRAAAGPAGKPLSGYVLAAYIVTALGEVADPVILKATDPRLRPVVLEAMRHWRFKPGRLNGQPVASTAAQEFVFGSYGSDAFVVDHVAIYQTPQVLLRRLPNPDTFGAYVEQLKQVEHDFFVGATRPETFSVVVELWPGRRSRVWFVSSRRASSAPELGPLRALLEGVPPVDALEGPAAFAIVGSVAGGDPKSPAGGRDAPPPIPAEWREAVHAGGSALAFGTDEFLRTVWREAR